MAGENEVCDVVVCADGRFALGAWIAIWSAQRHADSVDRLRFHVITTEAESAPIRKLARLAERWKITLAVVSADRTAIDGLPASERLPVFAYLRLLAPALLPGIERFLYLDSDVLVRSAVRPLFDTVRAGAVAAAARDYFHDTVGHRMGDAVRPGFRADAPYFNTGVMVMHSPNWRAGRVSERAMEYLAQPDIEIVHGDQDGLNAIFRDEVTELDPGWNVQMGALDFFERTGWPAGREALRSRRTALLRAARVAHFLGPVKPWDGGGRVPYAAEYRRAIVDSGWVSRWRAPFWRAGWFVRTVKRAVMGRLRAGP